MPSFTTHQDFSITAIAVAPSPATTGVTVTVTTGEGIRLPPTGSGHSFWAVVYPASAQPLASNAEIVLGTAVSGDVVTIVRAQGGTSARAIVVGDKFSANITSEWMDEIEAAATSKVYGYFLS